MPVTTSAAYKLAVAKNNRTWRAIITVYLRSGNIITLTENDITLGTLAFEEASTCTEGISVGSTYSNSLNFSLQNPSSLYNEINFFNARLVANIGLQIGENPDGTAIWEIFL